MKNYFLTLSILLCPLSLIAASISGEVHTTSACLASKNMVWLSTEDAAYDKRILLMHTFVPNGGSFEFYTRPGNYRVIASNEKGCSFEKIVQVQNNTLELNIELKQEAK